MIDLAENPRAVIGDNAPPLTPFEAISAHVADLMTEAQGFLDGEPITTQGQADAVGRLLAAAREARNAAEAQRKQEVAPFDEGRRAVQALWTPLTDEKTGKCALIASTAKRALAPFFAAEQARMDAEAAEARKIAEEAAEAAREAQRAAEPTDLASRQNAEALLKEADKADKLANCASKKTAMAAGGARSVSQRSVWNVTLTNSASALRHYRERQPEALKAWLTEQARQDVRAGVREIPGFEITESRVAQ